MNNPIYLSTGAFQTRSLGEVLELCELHKLRGLELSSGLEHDARMAQWISSAHRFGPLLVHNYFPAPAESFVLNLASNNEELLNRSIQFCKQAIDLSAEVGAPFYSVHAGFALPLSKDDLGDTEAQLKRAAQNDIDYEGAWQVFVASVDALSDYANKKGIGLLLENNVVTSANISEDGKPHFLLASTEEFERLFSELSNPNLGILLDVGHLKVSAKAMGFDRAAFFSRLRPYIKAFHLSENDGLNDTNLPVQDNSWFLPYITSFPEAIWVLEAYRLTVLQINKQLDLLSSYQQNRVGNTGENEQINSRQSPVLS